METTKVFLTMLGAVLLLVCVAVTAGALNGPDPGDGDVVFVVGS